MTTVKKNFEVGDFVTVNENSICDSADYEFLMQYAGKNLFIVYEKEIDPELWHYTCKDENGDIVMFYAYNKKPVPFAFIDADLEKMNLVATAPEVGKKVYLGCNLDDSEKVNDFVDANQGKAFEILEVGNYTCKLKNVPYRVSIGNIYELQKLENIPLNKVVKAKAELVKSELIPMEIRDQIEILSVGQNSKWTYWNKYDNCELCSNIRLSAKYKEENLWVNIYHGIGYKHAEIKDLVTVTKEPDPMDQSIYYKKQEGKNKVANELQHILHTYYFEDTEEVECCLNQDTCFIEDIASHLETLQYFIFSKKIDRNNVKAEDIKGIENFLNEVKKYA